MIANIDKLDFRILCKGDQRNRVADGGEVESQEIFFSLMLHILQHMHMLTGVILSCLKVSSTIYKTKSSKSVAPHQTSSLSSKLKEPTVSLTSLLRNPMGISC